PHFARWLRVGHRIRVGEHQDGVADLELGVPDLAVGPAHDPALLGVERLLVEVDRLLRVLDGEARVDAVVALGNPVGGHGSSSRCGQADASSETPYARCCIEGVNVKTDAQLIQRAREDPDAFAELYLRHRAPLYRWFRARAPEAVAAELTAEAFAQAALGLKRFRNEANGSAAPW